MEVDINTIQKQFVDLYYETFSTNRERLADLYRDTSMLTWEGEPFLGKSVIHEKLTSLPFQKIMHKITTQDVQPGLPAGAIIVLVTGLLVVDDSTNPLQFSQTFQLFRDSTTYYIANDIFRLNYGQ